MKTLNNIIAVSVLGIAGVMFVQADQCPMPGTSPTAGIFVGQTAPAGSSFHVAFARSVVGGGYRVVCGYTGANGLQSSVVNGLNLINSDVWFGQSPRFSCNDSIVNCAFTPTNAGLNIDD